jgi:hypothetical protein
MFLISLSVHAQKRGPMVHAVMKRGVTGATGLKVFTKSAGNQLQGQLSSQARVALGARTFGSRNRAHAKAVGFESGLLAARAAGIKGGRELGRVIGVFTKASRQSGEAFSSAFTVGGQKIEAREGDYKKAMNAAGPVASKHLVALAHALTGKGRLTAAKKKAIRGELATILANVRVEDLATLVGRDLGKRGVRMSGSAIVRSVQSQIPKDDWAYGDIAKMKTRGKGDRPLTERQLTLLSGALRLANATWKAGQVHRAAWEGNTSRITPTERGGVYNPYDVLKVKMYNDTYSAAGRGAKAEQAAISRVVFEVFKDLKQLTPQ